MAALAITGPAGIGRTTVWRESIRRSEVLGHRVLAARPTQAERSLAFAGLADLLGSVGRLLAHAGSLLMPVDEVVLSVFRADAESTIRGVNERAAMPLDRIAEVTAVGFGQPD